MKAFIEVLLAVVIIGGVVALFVASLMHLGRLVWLKWRGATTLGTCIDISMRRNGNYAYIRYQVGDGAEYLTKVRVYSLARNLMGARREVLYISGFPKLSAAAPITFGNVCGALVICAQTTALMVFVLSLFL
ncbi:hypothetical protein [Streptomyces sp. SM11]|uniref:hypothetical protein n=1 Tax=Streptomyces sp. SM11 TaxID=565557 RepID=UPI000CD55E01|nr:hypothetical protein [Streptomyces sp. SM11]